jgi:hypothetical protein
VRVIPTICFPFIKSFLSELRHAALVKREAFFVPGIRRQTQSAIFEQTVANYGERELQTGSQVLYRKEDIKIL